jgi:hypothetical protein
VAVAVMVVLGPGRFGWIGGHGLPSHHLSPRFVSLPRHGNESGGVYDCGNQLGAYTTRAGRCCYSREEKIFVEKFFRSFLHVEFHARGVNFKASRRPFNSAVKLE